MSLKYACIDCDGCHCHVSPPCNHCVDHALPEDFGQRKIFKSTDPILWPGAWLGLCMMEECKYPNRRTKVFFGRRLFVSPTWQSTMDLMEDHAQEHLEKFRDE